MIEFPWYVGLLGWFSILLPFAVLVYFFFRLTNKRFIRKGNLLRLIGG